MPQILSLTFFSKHELLALVITDVVTVVSLPSNQNWREINTQTLRWRIFLTFDRKLHVDIIFYIMFQYAAIYSFILFSGCAWDTFMLIITNIMWQNKVFNSWGASVCSMSTQHSNTLHRRWLRWQEQMTDVPTKHILHWPTSEGSQTMSKIKSGDTRRFAKPSMGDFSTSHNTWEDQVKDHIILRVTSEWHVHHDK